MTNRNCRGPVSRIQYKNIFAQYGFLIEYLPKGHSGEGWYVSIHGRPEDGSFYFATVDEAFDYVSLNKTLGTSPDEENAQRLRVSRAKQQANCTLSASSTFAMAIGVLISFVLLWLLVFGLVWS